MDSWLESFARTNFRRSTDTAHDLKTPLNVAVLNLELLRMRVSKLAGGEDERVNGYARSIELELRRMARIFDAFFVLTAPPKDEGTPGAVDAAALCHEMAADASVQLAATPAEFLVTGHRSRIRQAFALFFEGLSGVFGEEGRETSVARTADRFTITVTGTPAAADFEMTKIFKFYYTDALGNPDLALAEARLIAETYGGELNAEEDHDKVAIRLSFPGHS